MTIIEQIKAEIERLKEHTAKCGYPGQDEFADGNREGRNFICDKLLSFLSTLESEKPMNQEGLVEEVKRYYSDNFAYISSDQPTLSILTNVARHFAEWGYLRAAEKYNEIEYNRQREEESEKPMNLEEEINRYLHEECSDDDEPGIHEIAEHFAKWGAEHLKK